LLGIGLLGVASSVLVAGCGGGNAVAVKSVLTATLAATTGTDATTTGSGLEESFPVTVTVSETIPGELVTVTTPPVVVTVTAPTETVTATTPAQTVTATAPAQTTTVVETTTVSHSAGAAAAGAAVASSQETTDSGLSTEAWIALAILLFLIVAGGIFWLVRSRHNHNLGEAS
jgi:cobalamin biosynthesis Mg chelatase CobN